MRAKTSISERRACQLLGLARSVLHYETQKQDDGLKARLVELAGERRRFGYRRLHILIEREGVEVNHKRIHRLYQEAGLAVRRGRKRERVAVERRALVLRRQPPGRPRSTQGLPSVAAEAALVRLADAAGVPVPQVAFELPDGSPAGDGYAMEQVAGETVGSRVLRLPELAAARAGLARTCGEVLARLHGVKGHEALGLRSQGPVEALDALEAAGPDPARLDMGVITAGVAVTWIGFRHPDFDWQGGRPGLVALQAALLGATVTWGLHVPVHNIAAFATCLGVAAMSFLMIVLFFSRTMGDAGKVFAMVFLAVQLSASGGVLPVELSGGLYEIISPWMPMTWTVQAIKAAMFGAYGGAWTTPMTWVGLAGIATLLLACWIGRWRYLHPAQMQPTVGH